SSGRFFGVYGSIVFRRRGSGKNRSRRVQRLGGVFCEGNIHIVRVNYASFFGRVLGGLGNGRAFSSVVAIGLFRRRVTGRSIFSKSWRRTGWGARANLFTVFSTHCGLKKGLKCN